MNCQDVARFCHNKSGPTEQTKQLQSHRNLSQASFQRGFLQRQTFTQLPTKDLIHQLIQELHPTAIDEEGDQVAEIGQQLQPRALGDGT